jgi:hypothetical protein
MDAVNADFSPLDESEQNQRPRAIICAGQQKVECSDEFFA